jgi:hypothetical protein
MKLISTAVFFAIVQVAAALDYHWRVYDNGGCDHSSPANQMFPPNPNAPYVAAHRCNSLWLTTFSH